MDNSNTDTEHKIKANESKLYRKGSRKCDNRRGKKNSKLLADRKGLIGPGRYPEPMRSAMLLELVRP
jgi:hypothetical protein